MELEEKLKAAKVPMIVVHFDENFETTYTEEYNLENFELSEWQIESFARILLPSIREYYKDPKHVQEANEWTNQQNKCINRSESSICTDFQLHFHGLKPHQE